MKKVRLTLYKYEGKKWFLKIRDGCEECDITETYLKNLVKRKRFKNKIDIRVYPWLDNIFSLLLKGGFHAPIVMINNRVFSQGIVPNFRKFEHAVYKEIKKIK